MVQGNWEGFGTFQNCWYIQQQFLFKKLNIVFFKIQLLCCSVKPKQIRSGDHIKIQPRCHMDLGRKETFPVQGSQAVQDATAAIEPKDGRSYDATNLL